MSLSNLTRISKNKILIKIITKLELKLKLSNKEISYLYSSSIILLEEYVKNSRENSFYLDFAYYIVLKLSIQTMNYNFLRILASNLGLYPIVNEINELFDSEEDSIKGILDNILIDNYTSKNGYIQTLQQAEISNEIEKEDFEKEDILYVAPTSYGKSEIMLNNILKLIKEKNHILIVVPKITLLDEMFSSLNKLLHKKEIKDIRIISHNEEFESFNYKNLKSVHVLTQERALTILNNNKHFYYDIIYIDEAHHLFNNDKELKRSELLVRLIKINKIRNRNTTLFYLSPVINDSDNLKIKGIKNKKIKEFKIEFNMKKPTFHFISKDHKESIINMYLNEYIDTKKQYESISDSILKNSKNKNLIYFYRPIQIENFIIEKVINYFPNVVNPKLDKMIDEIGNFLSPLCLNIESLKKGVIYIHAKLPNILKKYLMYKFKKVEDIKYLISNTSVLEGVNLPLDNIFLGARKGIGKAVDFLNLIGRVNRLNTIFNGKVNKLEKLNFDIYLLAALNFENYKTLKLETLVPLLRKSVISDVVENIHLEKRKKELSCKEKEEMEIENDLIKNLEECEDNIKSIIFSENIHYDFSKSGIDESNKIKRNYRGLIKNIELKIKSKIIDEFSIENVLNLIKQIFIDDNENIISNYEFKRLKSEGSIKFYSSFIENSFKYTLKKRVNDTFKYYSELPKEKKKEFYIGTSHGELSIEKFDYQGNPLYNNFSDVYVNLNKKSNSDIYNYALIRTQMDDDFVKFTIMKYVRALFKMGVISQEILDKFRYGTTDIEKIKILKKGFTSIQVKLLEETGALKSNIFDNIGNFDRNKILNNKKLVKKIKENPFEFIDLLKIIE